jgi:hypothetical protein
MISKKKYNHSRSKKKSKSLMPKYILIKYAFSIYLLHVQRGSFGLKPQVSVSTNVSLIKVPSANLSQITLTPFENLPKLSGGPSTWQATLITAPVTVLPLGFSSPGVKKVLRLPAQSVISGNSTASLPMVKTIMKIVTIERILVINMIVREVQQGTRNVQYVKVLSSESQKCKA